MDPFDIGKNHAVNEDIPEHLWVNVLSLLLSPLLYQNQDRDQVTITVPLTVSQRSIHLGLALDKDNIWIPSALASFDDESATLRCFLLERSQFILDNLNLIKQSDAK